MDKLQVYLDWVNVMSYDFFNSLTPTTGPSRGDLYRAAAGVAHRSRCRCLGSSKHLAAGIPPEKARPRPSRSTAGGFAGVQPVNSGLKPTLRAIRRLPTTTPKLADKLIGQAGFSSAIGTITPKAPLSVEQPLENLHQLRRSRNRSASRRSTSGRNHLGGMMFWELSEDRNDELLDVIVRSLRIQLNCY